MFFNMKIEMSEEYVHIDIKFYVKLYGFPKLEICHMLEKKISGIFIRLFGIFLVVSKLFFCVFMNILCQKKNEFLKKKFIFIAFN